MTDTSYAIDVLLVYPKDYKRCPKCGRIVQTVMVFNNEDFCGYPYLCIICWREVTLNGRYVPCP